MRVCMVWWRTTSAVCRMLVGLNPAIGTHIGGSCCSCCAALAGELLAGGDNRGCRASRAPWSRQRRSRNCLDIRLGHRVQWFFQHHVHFPAPNDKYQLSQAPATRNSADATRRPLLLWRAGQPLPTPTRVGAGGGRQGRPPPPASRTSAFGEQAPPLTLPRTRRKCVYPRSVRARFA